MKSLILHSNENELCGGRFRPRRLTLADYPAGRFRLEDVRITDLTDAKDAIGTRE